MPFAIPSSRPVFYLLHNRNRFCLRIGNCRHFRPVPPFSRLSCDLRGRWAFFIHLFLQGLSIGFFVLQNIRGFGIFFLFAFPCHGFSEAPTVPSAYLSIRGCAVSKASCPFPAAFTPVLPACAAFSSPLSFQDRNIFFCRSGCLCSGGFSFPRTSAFPPPPDWQWPLDFVRFLPGNVSAASAVCTIPEETFLLPCCRYFRKAPPRAESFPSRSAASVPPSGFPLPLSVLCPVFSTFVCGFVFRIPAVSFRASLSYPAYPRCFSSCVFFLFSPAHRFF